MNRVNRKLQFAAAMSLAATVGINGNDGPFRIPDLPVPKLPKPGKAVFTLDELEQMNRLPKKERKKFIAELKEKYRRGGNRERD